MIEGSYHVPERDSRFESDLAPIGRVTSRRWSRTRDDFAPFRRPLSRRLRDCMEGPIWWSRSGSSRSRALRSYEYRLSGRGKSLAHPVAIIEREKPDRRRYGR